VIPLRLRCEDRPHQTPSPCALRVQALVKAAIDGRLPRGFGVKRLMDLPMGWSDQWSALGLKAPAQT
jgi:site-specific DNA recombinase